MPHCTLTIDLLEHCNYSPNVQLQAGAPLLYHRHCQPKGSLSNLGIISSQIDFFSRVYTTQFPTSNVYCCLSSVSFANLGLTSRLHRLRAHHQQRQRVHHLGCRKHMETGEFFIVTESCC